MDTSDKDGAVVALPKRGWRRHSDEFKARVIEMAQRPNVSVAAVAMTNGLNANMLRRWVRESELAAGQPRATAPGAAGNLSAFVPVTVSDDGHRSASVVETEHSALPPVASHVTVEIRRGATTVQASLPLDEHSAAWLREVLG